MKLIVEFQGKPPIEIEGAVRAVRVLLTSSEHFELREQADGGMRVLLEQYDGGLTMDLAVFPNGGNSVRLKGGLR